MAKGDPKPIWLDMSDWTKHLGVIEMAEFQAQVRCPCGGEVALRGSHVEAFCPQCERPFRMHVRIKALWQGGKDAAG